MASGPLELEDCEIKSWTPKPAKFDAKGEQLQPPKLAITFHVDMEQIGPDLGQLAWWFHKGVPVTVTLDGVVQTKFSDAKGGIVDAAIDGLERALDRQQGEGEREREPT
ncbi:MAG: hypothetical protein M3O91_09745, partial [Chloroflexota bacterium]|nr:hypothetical protein [Chloroflexota bacterium]